MLNRHFLVTVKESAYLGIVKDDLQIRQRETKVNLPDLSPASRIQHRRLFV